MLISELSTPALILDEATVKKNLETVVARANELGINVRPHYKSHRSPQIAKMQIAGGCKGVCCATIGEAEDCADAGIDDVMIANELVIPPKIKRAAEVAKKTKFSVCVDTVENIMDLEKAAADAGSVIHIWTDVNVGQNRCGVNTKEELLELAKAVMAQPHLDYMGINAYEGQLSHEPDEAKAYEISVGVENKLAEMKAYLESNGVEVKNVSGLSTASFSLRKKLGKTIYTEAQCGSFFFLGNEYRNIKYPPFNTSLFLLASVVSTKPNAFHTDAGLKSCSVDNGNPTLIDYPELASGMSEEHVSHFMDGHPYKPGDKVKYLIGHCCTTVNLHDRIYLVSGDEVKDVINVTSRGKSQ